VASPTELVVRADASKGEVTRAELMDCLLEYLRVDCPEDQSAIDADRHEFVLAFRFEMSSVLLVELIVAPLAGPWRVFRRRDLLPFQVAGADAGHEN